MRIGLFGKQNTGNVRKRESGLSVSSSTSSEKGTKRAVSTDKRYRCAERAPTLQQQLVRRRRLAIVSLIASFGIVCRWHVANLEPTYPAGEGVYAKHIATEPGRQNPPDAALFYKAAWNAFHVEYPESLKNGSHLLIQAPVAVQRPVIEQAQPAFALLRQGMQYSYNPEAGSKYFAVDSEDGASLPSHDFRAYRELSRLLAVEARVKASGGDASGALQSSLDAVRLGGDCGQGPSLLEGMLGVLCQMIGVTEAVRHVDGLSAPEARAGIQRLRKILETERTFAQMMTDERNTRSYGPLKTVFRNGAIWGFHPATGEAMDLRNAPGRFAIGAAIFGRTKQGIVSDFARQYDRILNRAKMPYQLAARLHPVPPSASPLVRYWLGDDYARAHYQIVRQSAYNRVLLTQLAVQAYRQEHQGTVPSLLKDLTTGQDPYLPSVPEDPFSISGRAPLRYSPATATVYSVGDNGRDDGNKGDDNSHLYE